MVQSFNLDAILYFLWARFAKKSLAIPHFSVSDIGGISPGQLRDCGVKGVIFDKDNTLTLPYVNELYPSIRGAFSDFKDVFGDKMVIMSNSAGTRDDANYEDARQIENDLGIAVLRHDRKKPGGIESVMGYFGCDPVNLVMVGDRIFTDVVFGNRYGMLTVHTSFLSENGDNKVASLLRKYELSLTKKWVSKGHCAPVHPLYGESVLVES